MRKSAVLVVACLILPLAGCHKKPRPAMPAPPDSATEPAPLSTAPAPPPVPVRSAPPVPPPTPPPPPTPFLDEAERDFEAGRYANAARAYQKHLATAASDHGKDRALYHLALSSSLSNSGPQATGRTLGYLQQLVTSYPRSSYVAEARLIIGLIQEVQRLEADAKEREERAKRLADELERLKKIDMQRRAPRAP